MRGDTIGTVARPVNPDVFAILRACEPGDQVFASGTDTDVSLRVIRKISFIELPPRTSIRGLRFGNNDRDTCLYAGQDCLALVVPLVHCPAVYA